MEVSTMIIANPRARQARPIQRVRAEAIGGSLGEKRKCRRKHAKSRRERANDLAVRFDLNRLRHADAGCGKYLSAL
jgi:hypothetical protein